MGSDSTQFLRKIVESFYSIQGIILSDNEGLHICSAFCHPQKKQQNEKFIQTATLLISAISQTDANFQKTKTYSNLQTVNFYYHSHLIHIFHSQNLMLTLIMNQNTNIHTAKQISQDIVVAFEKLNNKIPEIKSHC